MQTKLILPVVAMLALPLGAAANPISTTTPFIDGGLTMYGDVQPVLSDGTTAYLDTATGLDFIGDDFKVDTPYGDLAASGIKKDDVGWISDFQFNPLSPAPVNPLWSIGGFDFVMTSVQVVSQSTSLLHLIGSGYMTAAGFRDTGGTWDLKVSAKVGRFFFGATSATTQVPEPAPLLLFGAGLLGIALLRRRPAGR